MSSSRTLSALMALVVGFVVAPVLASTVDLRTVDLLLPTTDRGPVLVTPVSLAAGELDHDGIQDLVVGYATEAGGAVALFRANPDAIFPNSPEARSRRVAGSFTAAPFSEPGKVVYLEHAPDLLVARDTDADGWRDVVAAARGGTILYVLRGDREGGLGTPVAYPLPGRVTAMAAGDPRRPDRGNDLALAVVGNDGPCLLLYSGTGGLRLSTPEVLPLPARGPWTCC